MPICTKCGTDIPANTQDGQDNSTFVCDGCQDKINLKVWKSEIKTLKGLTNKVTPSQLKRLEFVDKKVKSLEAK